MTRKPIHCISGGCFGVESEGCRPQDSNSRVSLLGAGRTSARANGAASSSAANTQFLNDHVRIRAPFSREGKYTVFDIEAQRERPFDLARRARARYEQFGRQRTCLLTAAIGKSCGECTLCCSALEIDELKKPAGPKCENCGDGGCGIYVDRPQVCRDFECEWLMSRRLPPHFRPDRIGVLFMEDYEFGEYRAVCSPSRALGVASSQSLRASGRSGEDRAQGRGQVGASGLARVPLRRMGTDRVIGAHKSGA